MVSFSIAVRVGHRHLRRRDRVGRIGDCGRPLEQTFQAFVLRAFQSALCQPILSDFVAGPCTPHLAPKIAHFGHRESRLLGDDHQIGVAQGILQSSDQLLFARSVHCSSPNLDAMNRSSHPVAHGPFDPCPVGQSRKVRFACPRSSSRASPREPEPVHGRNSVQLPSIAGDCLITSAPKDRIGDLQSRTGWRDCSLPPIAAPALADATKLSNSVARRPQPTRDSSHPASRRGPWWTRSTPS